MKDFRPTAAYIEETRCVLQKTHADLKTFRRGIEASNEAVRRSSQLAKAALRKVRSLENALVVK
jgi:hypothetical protein